ncbi:MFS transporter [Corynebacterium sp. TAE3-ERU12]|uniref:MFS transporter n=1 Tax=Corynebacterium sp. TAE3-ERU12 TaxID=2849491 RepID=UPI00351D869A
MAFDGYDVVVYGATLTSLREEWDLDPSTAGLVGSAALVGMLLGALCVGPLSARFGRRRTFIAAVAWFSILMVGCAAAPTAAIFAVLRILSGIGLGAVLPLAAAMTVEHAPLHRRNIAYVLMQTGFPVGGLAAALVSMNVLPHHSWHWMYLFAGLPLVVVVLPAVLFLPESQEEPNSGGATGMAALRMLLAPGTRLATVLFWAMSFCSLLFVYGANTWLPTLMHDAGSTITKSLGFLLSFNAGAIVGGIFAGAAADRWGSRPVVCASFLLGSAGVVAFAFTAAPDLLLALAAVTGYGAVATQTLINGWVTRHYPPEARTTGIGWSLGIGRLGAIAGPAVTGFIVAATGGGQMAFILFACLAAVGAVLASQVRPHPEVQAA